MSIIQEPNKERFIKAVRGETPDRVPYFDNEFSPHVINAVLGKEGLPDSKGLEPNDLVDFSRKIGLDCVYTSFNWGLGRVYRSDSYGIKHYVDGYMKDRSHLAAIKSPDMSREIRRIEALSEIIQGTSMGMVLGIISPYKLVKAAMGYQDFLIKTEDDMPFLEEFNQIALEHLNTCLEQLLQFPFDAVMIPGDLCTGSGPMISPDKIRYFWLDTIREFIRPAKEHNIPVILHMDGDFSRITDIMIESGADAFHPFEVTGNLDIYQQKNQLNGKVAIMGNIDCTGVLLYGTPNDVREDVKVHIEQLAPGGGYLCGSSHEIMPDIPLANFYAMIGAIQEYGVYSI